MHTSDTTLTLKSIAANVLNSNNNSSNSTTVKTSELSRPGMAKPCKAGSYRGQHQQTTIVHIIYNNIKCIIREGKPSTSRNPSTNRCKI